MSSEFNSNDGQGNGHDEMHDLSQLRSSQTLITIAIIASPVSLIIGGVLLSAIAFVCALIAFNKTGRIASKNGDNGNLAINLNRQARIALIISIVALVINLVYFVITLVALYDQISSGNIDNIIDYLYGGGDQADTAALQDGADTADNGSIWD